MPLAGHLGSQWSPLQCGKDKSSCLSWIKPWKPFLPVTSWLDSGAWPVPPRVATVFFCDDLVCLILGINLDPKMNDWTLLDSKFAVGHFQYENSWGDFALFTGSVSNIFPFWEVEILLPPSAGRPILVVTDTGQLMVVDGWTIHTWQVSCLKLAMRGSGVGRVICSICLYLFNLSMGTWGGRCFIHDPFEVKALWQFDVWLLLASIFVQVMIHQQAVCPGSCTAPSNCIYIYICIYTYIYTYVYTYIYIYIISCHLSLRGLPIDRHCWLPHLHGIPFWDCRGWGERSSGDHGLT